ncbi:MAG: hypothetical protein IM638_02930 [Bacteroidetes bacterium]|nr:hypothetical protein [Bacteroidota bacterium]
MPLFVWYSGFFGAGSQLVATINICKIISPEIALSKKKTQSSAKKTILKNNEVCVELSAGTIYL